MWIRSKKWCEYFLLLIESNAAAIVLKTNSNILFCGVQTRGQVLLLSDVNGYLDAFLWFFQPMQSICKKLIKTLGHSNRISQCFRMFFIGRYLDTDAIVLSNTRRALDE